MRLARPEADAPPGVATVQVDVVTDGGTARRSDAVTVEEPLEIRLVHGPDDGRRELNVAVTMRTPGDDAALAIGFLYGEGVIRHASQVAGVVVEENVATVELAQAVEFDPQLLQRNTYTTSSCGICGKASIEAVRLHIPDHAGRDTMTVEPAVLRTLPERLREVQAAFARTGGLHASGAFDRHGLLVAAAEDVGRHNALDKLIGRFLLQGALPLTEHGLIFSGRASFELIQKAAMAGCPFVAAIGPPSSLAVELAAEQRMTLVGFLQEARFNVYTLPHRVAAAG